MLSVLRYRHIPYRFITGDRDDHGDMPPPKVRLLPILYFPDNEGGIETVVDSTPIIRRLEKEYPERKIVPENPVLRFLDYLLEDYADEWLTKAMFHYRWHHDADIQMAGNILPYWANISASEEKVTARRDRFTALQISRLYVVGSNNTTAPVIESAYQRFLEIFSRHLETYPYLMGNRPGASDFATHGQLTSLAQFDPTPAALTATYAPRVYAWVSLMEDRSGLEPTDGDWIPADNIPDTLLDLLTELGRTYVPVMLANDAAFKNGSETVETTVDGLPWVQQTFPYQSRCLGWIRDQYETLSPQDQNRIGNLLAGTGCEALFAKGT
jgi:glutathione S-transferase